MAEDAANLDSDDSIVPTTEDNCHFPSVQTLLPLPQNSSCGADAQEAWCENCEALEDWVYHRLLNRDDVYGCYCSLAARASGSKSYTAPADEGRRFPGALTSARIKQHFCGFDHGHLIGVHAISSQNTCRWFAIDIDQHNEVGKTAAVVNFNAAVHWCMVLTNLGFHPLLIDSNGNGGLHVWVVLREAVPAWVVYRFAQWLVGNHLELGLRDTPEIFPKQASLSDTCKYGNWLRLPGRHHSREHWTAVWDQSRWLTGEPAINRLVQTTGDDVNILRKWLQEHPVSSATEGQSGSAVTVAVNRPLVPASLPSIGNSAVPAITTTRLSLKTRKFLLGHFQHESQWNNRLFAAACDMAGNGFGFEDTLAQLLRGAGPYDDRERALATQTVTSAFSQVRHAAFSYTHHPSPNRSIVVGNIEVVLSPEMTSRSSSGRDG